MEKAEDDRAVVDEAPGVLGSNVFARLRGRKTWGALLAYFGVCPVMATAVLLSVSRRSRKLFSAHPSTSVVAVYQAGFFVCETLPDITCCELPHLRDVLRVLRSLKLLSATPP